eukprot:CAMPEP_0201582728 /NCGR_PEP_ID=MMETSP0190_2-20130828/89666_1 /ASSEMBLY_ACC=CAM_ASM_000263 /TAXON_ID=37353 /ORGANISM="Rosalina sp." /LENGTH=311 /DNA_ID=CAMNT_0048023263 /DNA_START=50 /DNA_END=985 /DNA_ORIENTATION=-
MASNKNNSTLETITQLLTTPKGFASVSIAIVGSLFVAKYISQASKNRTGKAQPNPNSNAKSNGYDSVIPFTVKQDEKPVIRNNNEFATIQYQRLPKDAQLKRSKDFFTFMNMRRSFRHFSDESVDMEVIRNCISVANTAPSGAHTSPWTFVVVTDPKKKMEIRKVVEAEEQINYDRRMKKTWVDALEPVISNLHSVDSISKPYLSTAPALIIVMKEMYRLEDGKKVDNYYPNQSTGIAAGMLFTALHNANLVTLPSTPMGAEKAIREICGRQQNEKVFLLMPIGYPAKDATIPYRTNKDWRKDMNKSMVIV